LKAVFYGFTIMAIEQGEIEKIAELSRIRISDEEIGQVTQRITEILQMVDQLQAVDTLDATQRLRPDKVTQSNRRDAFQAIAPAVENGLYLVPKVIE
jgi:aspartyl-tRNA(Asn)/glutamyl-tRNA(Gln) amidotransferase subunit C